MSAAVRYPTGEPLHRRHRRVLVLLANGHRNAELAEALGITTNTADMYVAQVLARLGARDRAHAVALALKHRIITLDEVEAHPELPLQEAS